MQVRISLVKMKCAAHHCATQTIKPFEWLRVSSAFDWIPERRRFAFGRDE